MSKRLDWNKVAYCGQQITILQELRDSGAITIDEFKEEVNKLLDEVD